MADQNTHARALRARQQQDLVKLAVLLAISPFMMRRIALESCSYLDEGLLDFTTCAAFADRSASHFYIARHYVPFYLQLLKLRGGYFWVPCTVWLHLTAMVLGAVLPPILHNRFVLPIHSAASVTLIPQALQLGRLLLTNEPPTPYSWEIMQLAPLFRLAFTFAFPVTPLVDVINNLTSHALCITNIALARHTHPSLQASWSQMLLLMGGSTVLCVILYLVRQQGHTLGSEAAPSGTCSEAGHGKPKSGASASSAPGKVSESECSADGSTRRSAELPAPCLRADVSVWGDAMARLCPQRLQPRGREGWHPRHVPHYRAFTLHTPVRLKLEGVEPHQLPPGWCERYAAEVAAQTQGCVVGVYVRQGCIELVVDLVSWAGNGQRGEAGEGGSNSSGCKSASPKLDIGRLVEALHLPQPPLSVVASCPPRPATYGGEHHGKPSAKHLQACRVPHITALQPRVVAVAGGGVSGHTVDASCADGPPAEFSLAVLLPRLQGTPTAASTSPGADQQQEQQGAAPELLLRARGSYLSATTAAAAPSAEGSSIGGSRWQMSGLVPATASTAEPSPTGVPEPLRVLARVSSLPASPGLLLVDCRVGGGPAAPASHCVPVLLVGDTAVAQELQAALQQWRAPLEELDQLVFDLGTWAEYAGQAGGGAAAAVQAPEHAPWSAGAAMWACGSSTSRPLTALGAHLLQYALEMGWLHTARWLMRGLQALGVDRCDLAFGTMLARGSPSILRAALTSYRAAVIQQALVWTLLSLLPRRIAQAMSRSARRGGRRGRSAQGMHSVWRALRHSMGLERGSPQEEDALRAYVDAWILNQCSIVLVFNTVTMAWVVWHSVQRSGWLLDAGSLPPLVYPTLGTTVALASALAPARMRTRMLSLSATLQHVGSLASYFLAFCLGHPPTPGTDSYMLGAGIVVAEGILLPAVALLSPATAAVLALLKLPLHARVYLKACQLQGLACAGSLRWALLRHACIALLSVATTLACNIYVRLRFAQQKLAAARALKD